MIECVIYQRCLYLFIDQQPISHEEMLVVYASDPNPTSLTLSLSLSLSLSLFSSSSVGIHCDIGSFDARCARVDHPSIAASAAATTTEKTLA